MISYSHVKLLPSSPVSLPKTFLLLLIITVAAAVSAIAQSLGEKVG